MTAGVCVHVVCCSVKVILQVLFVAVRKVHEERNMQVRQLKLKLDKRAHHTVGLREERMQFRVPAEECVFWTLPCSDTENKIINTPPKKKNTAHPNHL